MTRQFVKAGQPGSFVSTYSKPYCTSAIRWLLPVDLNTPTLSECRANIALNTILWIGTRSYRRVFVLLIALTGIIPSMSVADNIPNRTFELRTYTTVGGDLAKLHSLFENHSGRFFIKYGIQVIALWTPRSSQETPTRLVCLLAHESKERAIENWRLFSSDSRWQQFVREAGVDEAVISQVEIEYFDPTYYSPMK